MNIFFFFEGNIVSFEGICQSLKVRFVKAEGVLKQPHLHGLEEDLDYRRGMGFVFCISLVLKLTWAGKLCGAFWRGFSRLVVSGWEGRQKSEMIGSGLQLGSFDPFIPTHYFS